MYIPNRTPGQASESKQHLTIALDATIFTIAKAGRRWRPTAELGKEVATRCVLAIWVKGGGAGRDTTLNWHCMRIEFCRDAVANRKGEVSGGLAVCCE
jgi:hypothetical protein